VSEKDQSFFNAYCMVQQRARVKISDGDHEGLKSLIGNSCPLS